MTPSDVKEILDLLRAIWLLGVFIFTVSFFSWLFPRKK